METQELTRRDLMTLEWMTVGECARDISGLPSIDRRINVDEWKHFKRRLRAVESVPRDYQEAGVC